MPIEQVPGTDLSYHLIAFDSEGRERERAEEGELASRRALQVLANEPVTDVFLFSHGWQGDVAAARRQYNAWIGAMAGCTSDIERMRQARAGAFHPLLIGLHWPSLPWGDEDLVGPSVSFGPTAAPPVDALVDEYAGRIADTPAAREALRTILAAALDDIAPAPCHWRCSRRTKCWIASRHWAARVRGPRRGPTANRSTPSGCTARPRKNRSASAVSDWVACWRRCGPCRSGR